MLRSLLLPSPGHQTKIRTNHIQAAAQNIFNSDNPILKLIFQALLVVTKCRQTFCAVVCILLVFLYGTLMTVAEVIHDKIYFIDVRLLGCDVSTKYCLMQG